MYNFTPVSISKCERQIREAIKQCGLDKQYAQLQVMLAQVLWFKGDAQASKELFEAHINVFPDDIEAIFNLSFPYRALEEWDKYYPCFEKGVDAGLRVKFSGSLPLWNIHSPKKHNTVLVIAEQGVGDEIYYFHNLGILIDHADTVYVTCDPRLVGLLTTAFPSIIFIATKRQKDDVITIPADISNEITAWLPAGNLTSICYGAFNRHQYQQKYIHADREKSAYWNLILTKLKQQNKKSKAIGICWRSGLKENSRNLHYLNTSEVAYLCKLCPDTLFVNLQYSHYSKELKKIKKLSGVTIHEMPDLDLKDDFENTAALIANLDEVITAGTAIHRLANALGTNCHAFFAGTLDSDPHKPKKISQHETCYFFPPMSHNKHPLLEQISQNINHKTKKTAY